MTSPAISGKPNIGENITPFGQMDGAVLIKKNMSANGNPQHSYLEL